MNHFWNERKIRKDSIECVQINLGNRCNLACSHCHIGASPHGSHNMDKETAEKIVEKLKKTDFPKVEFTGGEPILNPHLVYFIEALSGIKDISVRTNLVSLGLPGNHDLIELMCTHAVTLIGSLPSPFQSATDSQRGKGVFEASIKVLQQLNHKGYGDGIGLKLNLVYNPTGDFLPPECGQLEYDYRGILKDAFGIQFNSFIPIVNVPIKRFRKFLEKEGTLSQYEHELFTQFNSATIEKIMCRYLISVDNKGYVYDCDFNLATGTRIKGYENVRFWDINFDVFEPEISFDKYCYACTVNQGSSCHGTLVKDATSAFNVKDSVKTYYGDILTSSNDLQTNACCTIDSIPHYVRESLRYVNDEIKMKYYGCGSPIPYVLEGLQALDVGCGTGRDVYVLSRLVGEHGFVWGIDMTEKQLDVAKKHMDEQMEIFGYNKRNVGFIHDYIENLGSHFQKESLDLIISNCVMNLSEDKEVVLQQIFDVLKHGGEFYFSDVYADRRVPAHIARNEVLYGECLGGALYYKDFERIARRVGFTDVRVVDSRTITINNPEIEQLVENITFLSVTYRLWKLRELEDVCEDYGHIAIYRGGIPFSLFKYELDREHVFYKNKPERVCGNTAMMIQNTRLGKYFEIIGDFSEHFGVFEECTTQSHEHEQENEKTGGCC